MSLAPVGIYVHVPFCASKCAYCDFVSYPDLTARHADYAEALVREVTEVAAGYGSGERPKAASVYFGGGTPTLLEPQALGRILRGLESSFGLEKDAETTVEANPDGLTAEQLRLLRSSGLNRLSVGVQSLDDDVLRTLGRRHDAAAAVEAVGRGREAGFDNLSLDLIFGVPGQ
ncbi:MAG: radical SAM protein [Actinobacteria bacterium]|nr:MAG: radical SAM protein [Actinomycetota bacterium]